MSYGARGPRIAVAANTTWRILFQSTDASLVPVGDAAAGEVVG
jgi:hypothetical protein